MKLYTTPEGRQIATLTAEVSRLTGERDMANARLHEVAVACATAEEKLAASESRVVEVSEALHSLLSCCPAVAVLLAASSSSAMRSRPHGPPSPARRWEMGTRKIPENAVPCTCGKGYIVDCADGTVGCTATITKFEAVHGSWGVEYTVRQDSQKHGDKSEE